MAGSDDTAQPPLVSGFGAVMEEEEDIRSSTERSLDSNTGPNSPAINRVLQHQRMRLGANIALLEQRYETLPHPVRFHILHARHGRIAGAPTTASADVAGILSGLISQHLSLLRKIETLIHQRPDGQRGELILAEIARNHEDMAGMLTSLLKEDAAGARPEDEGGDRTSKSTRPAEENWDNEGGPASVPPPTV